MVDSPAKPTFLEPSLAKQKILSRYASGEIPWKTAADEISGIQPPIKYTWRQKMGLILSFLLVLIVPPFARQKD